MLDVEGLVERSWLASPCLKHLQALLLCGHACGSIVQVEAALCSMSSAATLLLQH